MVIRRTIDHNQTTKIQHKTKQGPCIIVGHFVHSHFFRVANFINERAGECVNSLRAIYF